jgi:hypothetical protein
LGKLPVFSGGFTVIGSGPPVLRRPAAPSPRVGVTGQPVVAGLRMMVADLGVVVADLGVEVAPVGVSVPQIRQPLPFLARQ